VVIVLLGVFAIVTTPTDLFPEMTSPSVGHLELGGLSTEEMASRVNHVLRVHDLVRRQ
jgi:multidrug efflux pump subunit AcrB